MKRMMIDWKLMRCKIMRVLILRTLWLPSGPKSGVNSALGAIHPLLGFFMVGVASSSSVEVDGRG